MTNNTSELKLIKQKIYNEQRIEELLEKLNCHHISHEQSGKLITAARPTGKNTRSIQIRNKESLTSHIRSKGIKGDIYTIVNHCLYNLTDEQELKQKIPQAKEWICKQLNYQEFLDGSFGLEEDYQKDYNSWLKKIKRQRQHIMTLKDISKNEVLDENILDNYIMLPNKWWLDEGIDIKIQKEFDIGFDLDTARMIFPMRNRYGQLIGVKGRIIPPIEHLHPDDKYIFLYPCYKSVELYGLWKAVEHIQERKQVLVVEGSKSVWFLHQWGYKNAVSIEGDEIADGQVALLKSLGLDIEIVLIYDKGVNIKDLEEDKGKDIKFIKEQAKKFKNRKVFAVYDTKGLLEHKDSPTDKGKEVFETLLTEHKYKIK